MPHAFSTHSSSRARSVTVLLVLLGALIAWGVPPAVARQADEEGGTQEPADGEPDEPGREPAEGAESQPASGPTSPKFLHGKKAKSSFGPDVYLEDITYTLRMTWFRALDVSEKNPDVAYVASWDGYVYKTVDGGQTWDESRLIVERRPFFGDVGQRLYFGTHRRGGGSLPHRTQGRTYRLSKPGFLRRTGNIFSRGGLPSYRPSRGGRGRAMGRGNTIRSTGMAWPLNTAGRVQTPGAVHLPGPGQPLVGFGAISPGGGGRAGAAGNSNFGIGLPGRAPRLQNVVRNFNKPTAGLNLDQTLLLRGSMPTEVRMVVIHPNNPKIVFACTMFGLYMTYDGGLNWVRTFQGVNPRGRMVPHVAVDPTNPKKVFLATGNGVYVSEDGGNNYIKMTQQGVGNGWINWIYFSPYDSRYVFIGTDFGLLRSKDGGVNFEWIYFTTFPTARVVRNVIIDPHDKKRGYIATHDGLFTTPNLMTATLEDWQRMGGLRFTGMTMIKIGADKTQPNHLWAVSNMRIRSVTNKGLRDTGGAFIWESLDGGTNWHVIYPGNTFGAMMWFEPDPRDPSLLWIVWSRSLSRMKRRDPHHKNRLSRAEKKKVDSLLHAERVPTIGQVLAASWQYTGIDPNKMLRYRERSQIMALVPRVDMSLVGINPSSFPLANDGLYPTLAYKELTHIGRNYYDFRAMLSWNFAPLIFNINAINFGRIERLTYEVRRFLSVAVHRYYGEYRRLLLRMITRPPKTLRVRVMYKLRLEELRSYIDFMTGGYLTRYEQGDRPDPYRTPWFHRWPGTGPDLKLPSPGGE